MAKTAKSRADKKAGGGSMGFLLAFLVLSATGAGAGYGLALHLMESAAVGAKLPSKSDADSKHADDKHSGDEGEAKPEVVATDLMDLAPIVTNLRNPETSFVRIEGSIVIEKGLDDAKTLASQISEDVVAFLRTTTLAQIQGASGLQNLREDINDRVRVRSEGKAKELIIHSLVVE